MRIHRFLREICDCRGYQRDEMFVMVERCVGDIRTWCSSAKREREYISQISLHHSLVSLKLKNYEYPSSYSLLSSNVTIIIECTNYSARFALKHRYTKPVLPKIEVDWKYAMRYVIVWHPSSVNATQTYNTQVQIQ